jgi:hypothetical protein
MTGSMKGSALREAGLALVIAAILAVYGFEAHALRRAAALPLMRADQAAYLQYAKLMHESAYSFVGDRNRMPAFPFLLSLVFRPGMTDAEFLSIAQSFNVNLTIVLLALLFLIFRKSFPNFYSIALVVITAFGVLIYRAGTVQVEPLFYFVSFAAFLFLLRMLIAPTYFLAVIGGAACGLAFLTKASALAALPIWALTFVIQSFLYARRSLNPPRYALRRRAGLLCTLLASFILTVSPYIWTSRQQYGQFFYNVNSAHYMWCDSWPEALTYSDKLRDPAIRNASLDQLPSAKKYWRTHSARQMIDRLLDGLITLLQRSTKVVGYFKFVLLLGLVAVALMIKHRRDFHDWLTPQPAPALFCLLFFTTYVLLYAWYGAVVTDSRFILALFLPFIFSTSIVIQRLGQGHVYTIGRRKYAGLALVAASLISLVLTDVIHNAERIIHAPGSTSPY